MLFSDVLLRKSCKTSVTIMSRVLSVHVRKYGMKPFLAYGPCKLRARVFLHFHISSNRMVRNQPCLTKHDRPMSGIITFKFLTIFSSRWEINTISVEKIKFFFNSLSIFSALWSFKSWDRKTHHGKQSLS